MSGIGRTFQIARTTNESYGVCMRYQLFALIHNTFNWKSNSIRHLSSEDALSSTSSGMPSRLSSVESIPAQIQGHKHQPTGGVQEHKFNKFSTNPTSSKCTWMRTSSDRPDSAQEHRSGTKTYVSHSFGFCYFGSSTGYCKAVSCWLFVQVTFMFRDSSTRSFMRTSVSEQQSCYYHWKQGNHHQRLLQSIAPPVLLSAFPCKAKPVTNLLKLTRNCRNAFRCYTLHWARILVRILTYMFGHVSSCVFHFGTQGSEENRHIKWGYRAPQNSHHFWNTRCAKASIYSQSCSIAHIGSSNIRVPMGLHCRACPRNHCDHVLPLQSV